MSEPTTIFSIYDDKDREIRAVLTEVYRALKEKGLQPHQPACGVHPLRKIPPISLLIRAPAP